ncbi:VPS9 domain-containing protein 1-like isoform X3 [Dermacentor variabilis]|uniref:VPS9 domain-containing protein 1-like isoform X3 n=1 Tax=Dermacentor variabilis TaxID=34621 RepID=UPI003F5AF6E1
MLTDHCRNYCVRSTHSLLPLPLLSTILPTSPLDLHASRKKAYVNYLKSLDAIAASLLKDYESHGIPETPVPVNNAKKVISVARQCLDRVEKIIGTSLNQFYAEQERCNETYSCPLPTVELETPCTPEVLGGAGLPSVAFLAPRILSRQSHQQPHSDASSDAALLSNPMFTVRTCATLAKTKVTRRVLSPMEQMEQENTAVCQRYHALIQRTVDPMAKQNLRLELQRRLMDNLMTGRKKQAEYLRNLQEQEKKIAEMAARKLQGSGECITPEEKRQQELFARILQYENNREWPPALQDMLESHPKNPKVARHIVMHILGDSKHPLSQWLAKERVALQREIVMALDSRSHLVAAPKEPSSGGNQRSIACAHVESVLRTALLLLGLTLEPLKDPAAQEVCYSVLEDHFTWPLWPHLLATVRLENLSGEQRVATTISQLASASAEEMHVSPCLHKSPALSEAVGMLRTVPRLGPSHKLRVLVHVTRLVCTEPLASEDEHHRKLMGADDLIPALIYILVQSKVPQLYSEYLALEQILDSRYMLGEEGYCLASVLMAFKYLESLP